MLDCAHEVVELREADWNQLQHGLAHVETRPASWLPVTDRNRDC